VEYTFGEIGGVAVLSTGELWVGDSQSNLIQRYDQEGNFLGSLGGKGEGPGEFQKIWDLAGMPDGSVAVWDNYRNRVSIFHPDGRFDTSFQAPFAGIRYDRPALQTDTSGYVYVRGRRRGPVVDFWVKMTVNGEIQDTIDLPSRDWQGPYYDGQGYPMGTMKTYPIQTTAVLGVDGRIVQSRNNDYAFHRSLPDGRTMRIERSWTPIPVKDAERAAFQEQEDHYARRTLRSPQRVGDQKPPWWSFWIDGEERFWVIRHAEGFRKPESDEERKARARFNAPLDEWWEPLIVDVIDPHGRFLGTLDFPTHLTRLIEARENLVWVIEEGEWGEHYVVRYRIQPG
jgi:hypothetical protein